MQIAKQNLPAADQAELARLQFLDLNHHVGRKHFPGGNNKTSARHSIFAVGKSNACTGITFDANLVATLAQRVNSGRRQSDPVLMVLDLLRYTDQHALNSLCATQSGDQAAWERVGPGGEDAERCCFNRYSSLAINSVASSTAKINGSVISFFTSHQK